MVNNPPKNSGLPDKLPPQDLEAEKCLLGSLMLDKKAVYKVVDFLKADDLYKHSHQKIFQSMVELFERSEPIDFLSLSTRLKEKKELEGIGGSAYLTECVNSVPTASHVANYAKIIQRKRILRDLIAASYDIGSIGFNETEDIDVLLDRAEKRIFGVAQKGLTQAFSPIKDNLEEAFQRIDNLSKHKGAPRGVPTGFTDLDNKLSGFQKSDLVILASRPSIGKSSLALDFARNVAVKENTPVGIFSLEMSTDQIIDRLIASQANIDLWKIRTGHLSDSGENNDFVRIQEALGVLSEAPIFVDDAAITNILQMRAMARRLQAERGLGLLIIDYLQLMEPRNSNDPIIRQVTEISRSLKALAKELNIPILALSQLSRAVEQRTPQIPRLSDLRESGCLTGDTLITRADTGERITIKELAERKKQSPLPIMATKDDYKITVHQMTKAFYSGKKIVFELKTKTGRTIKASANHLFLKLEGWKRLDELQVEDRIATSKNPSNSDIFWDKIVSIKKIGTEDVYDATVKGAHNFLANDIIVHNSLEQDADVVMFIYREDRYRPDTSRRNIADILVSKHRNGPTGKVELFFDESRVTFRNLEKY